MVARRTAIPHRPFGGTRREWAFDLGYPLRRERGEELGEASNPDHQKTAGRRGPEFLHKASLPWRDEVKRRRLIPAEFAEKSRQN
jgi:hypothetical protein